MDNIIESLKSLAVGIDSVRQDPRNARQHPVNNLEAISRSLKQYGQRKPIVVNAKTLIIEAGNGLWRAAKELGWDKIAAVMVEDSPETATGYAIMDNQSALLSDWGLPILKDLLIELDEMNYDMDLTGFDKKAIEDLMTQFHVDDEDNGESSSEGKDNKCPKCGHEW
jgi:site-specific DNA-methyltransferase (adenine-specific)